MEAGLDSTCGDTSKIVGGFADFEGGKVVRFDWISGWFPGTESTKAEAAAAGAALLSSQ